jgi:hypothetical protein
MTKEGLILPAICWCAKNMDEQDIQDFPGWDADGIREATLPKAATTVATSI